jgi:predicted ATPase
MTLEEWKKALSIVEAMTDDAIYIARDTVAAMAHRAHNESRELMAETDCRAAGYVLRGIAERLEDRILSVTRP